MSNMSYCRFENTYRDLLDCQSALEEQAAGDAAITSADELHYAQSLVDVCVNIVLLMAEEADINVVELDKTAVERMQRALRRMTGGN